MLALQIVSPMKSQIILILLLAVTLLAGCSKNDALPLAAGIGVDNGCVQNITQPVGAHSLPTGQLVLVNNLFDRNHLSHANLRYFQYQRDSLRNFSAPTRVLSEVVRVYEFVNGLKVFTAQTNFVFWNGDFHYRAGSSPGATALSPVPRLSVPQVRWLFREAIGKYDPRATIENQCVEAELGYYNLNGGQGGQPEKLVRAWRVTKQGQAYPMAYFQDENGQLIYYDNALRTFQ